MPFTPSDDPARRLEQMASLATALTATGAEFSNDLTYIYGMASKSANCPAYEKEGMQVILLCNNALFKFSRLIMCSKEFSEPCIRFYRKKTPRH